MKSDCLPLLLLTAFGLGRIPIAPGTWGSLPPVVMALALNWLGGSGGAAHQHELILNLALIVVGLIFAAACLSYGRLAEQAFNKKDPGQVVADEVAGQCLALLFLPWRSLDQPNAWAWNVAVAAVAFVAFRVMDIIKPPPARGLQRLPSGAGILVDDLIAGLYALIVAQLASRFILPMTGL